ncbi:MAG: hypothetical protein UT36_C0009G0009 [Candidatus Peregrinibacteria bacterium GW2011_GWF2_39_17]|nr:MAG: hypothetical protein UT36_C0009G0009 [Candidatus Peregrinibacteria bacterium GW2011_GWF2_39_17]HCW32746.1 hypothetical protein [Candidatus Peregrinibacteria bacterium]
MKKVFLSLTVLSLVAAAGAQMAFAGTFSWHSDVVQQVCESSAKTGFWTTHTEVRQAYCEQVISQE